MGCMQTKVELKVIPLKTGKKLLVKTQLDRRIHDLIDFVAAQTGQDDIVLHLENQKLTKDDDSKD